jgi:hypothetical protein
VTAVGAEVPDPIKQACDDYWAGTICGGELLNILAAHDVPRPIIDLLDKIHGQLRAPCKTDT